MERQPHILVANEPGTYRHMLATELPTLRPSLHIHPIDPTDLDAAVAQFRPLLVISSRMSEVVRSLGAASIVLYPDGSDQAVVESAGQSWVLPSPRLADLLGAIDNIVGAAGI